MGRPGYSAQLGSIFLVVAMGCTEPSSYAGSGGDPDAGVAFSDTGGAGTGLESGATSRSAAGNPGGGLACPVPPRKTGDPKLPRAHVDTRMPKVAGKTIKVNAGDSFQAALDAAQPGDEIVLQAGATFSGPFKLPKKGGEAWIIIRSSAEAKLPGPGRRVGPADAANMPTLQGTSNEPVITTAAGAHHYRLIGLEVVSTAYSNGLIDLGDWDEPDPAKIAHHFVLDRMYVHPGPGKEARRGITLMVGHSAVINSHVGDFYEVGAQSQAILTGNSPGPLRIVDNYLSAASQVIMSGGFDNASEAMIPQDIEICNNRFFKPARFEPGHSNYPGAIDGRHHFESKYSKRVLISGNIMENNWNGGYGFAILLKANNETGGNPWTDTSDYTIAYNYIKNSDFGFSAGGDGDGNNDPRNHHHMLAHNLFEDIHERVMMLGNGLDQLQIVNNTFITKGAKMAAIFIPDSRPVPSKYQMTGFRMNNNIITDVSYTLMASGMGNDLDEITGAFFTDTPSFDANVFVTDDGSSQYKKYGIDLVRSASQIGFVDLGGRNYRLSSKSPYRGAGADGKDLGADIDAIARATGVNLK